MTVEAKKILNTFSVYSVVKFLILLVQQAFFLILYVLSFSSCTSFYV